MPKCLECGFEASRLQWTHFKYKCTGRFKNGKEYIEAYPGAKVVDSILAKKTAITLENLQTKYGNREGAERWNQYRKKQSISNTYEYKKEKYNWSKEQFDEFNKSRSVTLMNLISRHGEIEGTSKWLSYCERQGYTNTKDYFVEKYGEINGTHKYQEICIKKSHSIETIMLRHNCDEKTAKEIIQNYNQSEKYSSNIEKQFVDELENTLKESLDYSYKTKQYCVYYKRPYFYDIIHNNKAIEFNGDYWHCNPTQYPSNFYHKHSEFLAEDIWKNDKNKIDILKKERNIDTLVIWESDYISDNKTTINRCIAWLKH